MIYVLEDEGAILDLICYALKSQNIPVKGFSLAKDFYKALKDGQLVDTKEDRIIVNGIEE